MRHCGSKPARYSWQCIAPKTQHKNILHPRPRNNAPKMHCTIVITPTRHHQRCLCNLHMRMPASHAVTSQWAIWCVLATKQSYPPPLWGSACQWQAWAYSAQARTGLENIKCRKCANVILWCLGLASTQSATLPIGVYVYIIKVYEQCV